MSERRDEPEATWDDWYAMGSYIWRKTRAVNQAGHHAYLERVTDRMLNDSPLALAACLNMARERDMYEHEEVYR